jgi:hypothetical protein
MKTNGRSKHLKAAGLADTKVSWLVLASALMNDALLSAACASHRVAWRHF